MAMLHRGTFRFFLPLVGALLIAGCAKKVDGSSEEAYRASIFAITKDLPPDKRAQFQEAVALVTLKSLNLGALFTKQATSGPSKTPREQLNGKNADQVIQLGQEVRAAREKSGAKQPIPFKGPLPMRPDGLGVPGSGAPAPTTDTGQPQA